MKYPLCFIVSYVQPNTAERIKNWSKSTSAIKVAHYENKDDFHYEGKPSHSTVKLTLLAVNKGEWDTKEDTGKSMRMHCMYCSMPIGTSRAEAMLNVEKIKSVALAVIELLLSEGISQSVRQAVSQWKLPFNLNSVTTC